jgi:hypothetical protein
MCRGTKDEIKNSEEDLKVAEYLGGKAVYEKTQLQTESLRSSVKLCQEGIEQVHRVQEEPGILRQNC